MHQSDKIYLSNPICQLGVIEFETPVFITIIYHDIDNKKIHFEWDFGMADEICYDTSWLSLNQKNISESEIIKRVCEYDISHAFFHPEADPNYQKHHWALKGWLINRVKYKELI